MNYLGDFPVDATLYVPFHTFDSNGGSVTITGLAVGDIKIYKDGGTTERSSTNGYTLLDTDGIDFDSITGLHGFSIDLSDDSDSGFYAAGHEYMVAISTITADGQTISFWATTFSIERSGGALALLKHATYGLSAIETLVDDLETRLTAARAGYLDNLNVGGNVASSSEISGLNDPTAAAIADAVWDEDIVAAHNGADSAGAILDDLTTPGDFKADVSNLDAAVSSRSSHSAADAADAVWDETLAGHLGAGSTGEALNAAGAAGDPWTTALPGAYGAGSAGYIVGNNVDAAVSSRSSHSAADAADAVWDEAKAGHVGAGSFGEEVQAHALSSELPTNFGALGISAGGIVDADIIQMYGSAVAAEILSIVFGGAAPYDWSSPGSVTGATSTVINSSVIGHGNDAFNNCVLLMLDGSYAGHMRIVKDYTSVGGVFTLNKALPGAPSIGDSFVVFASEAFDFSLDGITVGTNGITAGSIATDAVDADALAADAITEIADGVLKRDWTAVTGEAARSVLNALRSLRNKVSVSGSTLTVTKEDDSTSAWTATVATDAAADPITEVDPT